jgi:hypothetical protein
LVLFFSSQFVFAAVKFVVVGQSHPEGAVAGKIFISYRRDDSRYQAAKIYDAFVRGLPRENIFMDVDTIPLGVDFVKVLEGWVEQCEVLLVLMGPNWANSTDPKTRKRRVDNPKDFVRVELRGALTRDIPVVPVLLDGAELPDEADLPDDIKGLLNRNAEFVDFRTFDADVQRLIKKLGVSSNTKQTAAPATVGGTAREQVVERNALDTDTKTQGDLLDKVRETRPFDKEWRRRWLTPVVAATVLLAVGVIGTLVSWSPGLLSGGKVEGTTKEVDRAREAADTQARDAAFVKVEKDRQAAEAIAADAEKARQATETKLADAVKARQAAEGNLLDALTARQAVEAKADDAVKARQAAEAKAADAEKARQAAETKLADAEKARQAAEAKADDAEKARKAGVSNLLDGLTVRQAAEAKAADAENAPQATDTKMQEFFDEFFKKNPRADNLFTRYPNYAILGPPSSQTISSSSTDGCAQNCAKDISCKAYQYDRTNRVCRIYSSPATYNPIPAETSDSGIRR